MATREPRVSSPAAAAARSRAENTSAQPSSRPSEPAQRTWRSPSCPQDTASTFAPNWCLALIFTQSVAAEVAAIDALGDAAFEPGSQMLLVRFPLAARHRRRGHVAPRLRKRGLEWCPALAAGTQPTIRTADLEQIDGHEVRPPASGA